MTELEKALAKLDGENLQQGTPENEVREMVRLWCQVDEKAPALVLTEGKSCMGAYKAMYAYARAHVTSNTGASKSASVCTDPARSMSIIMEYFGAGTLDEAHSQLEAGLMARIIGKQMEQWATYTPLPNPQPATVTAPASEPMAQKPAFDLSELSLEDEL